MVIFLSYVNVYQRVLNMTNFEDPLATLFFEYPNPNISWMRHPLPDLLVLRPDENEKIDYTETGFTEGIFR